MSGGLLAFQPRRSLERGDSVRDGSLCNRFELIRDNHRNFSNLVRQVKPSNSRSSLLLLDCHLLVSLRYSLEIVAAGARSIAFGSSWTAGASNGNLGEEILDRGVEGDTG